MAGLLGDVWGFVLYAEGVDEATWLFYGTIFVALAALFLHPKKGREKAPGYTYAWHKACDLVICIATVSLLTFCTAGLVKPTESSHASMRWHKSADRVQESSVSETSTGHKQGFAGFLQGAKKWYSELSGGEKAGLIALTIILTLAFCFFWGALCCSIACNGMDTLAVILFVLGAGGAITACVFLCRRIIRGPKAQRIRSPG